MYNSNLLFNNRIRRRAFIDPYARTLFQSDAQFVYEFLSPMHVCWRFKCHNKPVELTVFYTISLKIGINTLLWNHIDM